MRWPALLVALTLTGCGGGLSRADYDERGERVITRAQVLIAADKEAVRAHPRDPEAYRRLAAHLERFADDLEAIGDPPHQLGARVDRILDHIRRGAKLFGEAADALAKGDIETFQAKGDQALKTVDQAAGSGMFG